MTTEPHTINYRTLLYLLRRQIYQKKIPEYCEISKQVSEIHIRAFLGNSSTNFEIKLLL
jgi:hypothetical protein